VTLLPHTQPDVAPCQVTPPARLRRSTLCHTAGEVPELPSTLEKVKLCSNQLSGELPEAPEALRVADFSHNQFTGPLPDSYANAEELRRLDVNTNKIDAIPEGGCAGLQGLLTGPCLQQQLEQG
jgi:hypothetical protein